MKRFRLLLAMLSVVLLTTLFGCFGPKKMVSQKERQHYWKEKAEHKKHKKKDADERKGGKDEEEEDGYDGIMAAQQREFDLTHDPATNTIPKTRLFTALAQRNNQIAQQIAQNKATNGTVMLNGTTLPVSVQNNWVERGSYADAVGPSNGNTRDSTASTSGRIAAFWADADPTKPNQVFVGGIDGGMWTCPDITASAPAWTFIDNFSNLAIASICQDPNNYNIMYFGTGEHTVNGDAVQGGGVWKVPTMALPGHY